MPAVEGLEAQWIGRRSRVKKDEPEILETELEKYKGLLKDVTSELTVLYVYGGAFVYVDTLATSSRPVKATLYGLPVSY